MLARYAAEKNQNLFHEIRPSFLCRAVEPACAKGGATFLKPLYDSIIQRYAQLEKVPESALVLLIKKAAACGSRDRKNSFNHCIKIKFLSPDYKAQNPKIDTKHEASQ